MATFGEAFLAWVHRLHFPSALPQGVDLLDPYKHPTVMDAVREFAHRFYSDYNRRIGVFGINPGRFGGGLTGLSFTDPYALWHDCRVEHQLGQQRELSATFVYKTIAAYGGAEVFFRNFYLSALSPLGFVRNGKNLNFYDDPVLERVTIPFIVQSLREQFQFPLCREVAIILGSGKLRLIAARLNQEYGFFNHLMFVEHPRYIMQYRRRWLGDYVERYVRAYRQALALCTCGINP